MLTLISAGSQGNNTSPCPSHFFKVPLPTESKYCQLFNQGLPASLSYFADIDQTVAKSFYLRALGQPFKDTIANGRNVLQFQRGEHTVIISKDGNGTQIDILVLK